MDKIDELYIICEMLNDDIDLVVLILREIGCNKHRPSAIKQCIESLNTNRISDSIDKVLSCSSNELIKWKIGHIHGQATMYDYQL